MSWWYALLIASKNDDEAEIPKTHWIIFPETREILTVGKVGKLNSTLLSFCVKTF